MDTPLEEIEFLARSPHRIEMLDTLAEGPRDRDSIRNCLSASAPTIGRILNDFEARSWVQRDGHEYTVTQTGAFVTEHFTALLEKMETERRLRDIWPLLPTELPGFSLDLVADAVITTVEPGNPYAPANRCASFYPTTDRVRGFDAAVTAPHNFETLAELVMDGLELEFVLPPDVSIEIEAAYPDTDRQMDASENVTVWWNESLPLNRLIIFDDRVGVGGYDPEMGILAVYVDSDSPELREWALSTFERVRRESQPEQTQADRS